MTDIVLAAPALRQIVRDICLAGGSKSAEAQAVADNLVAANLAGHDSHGVGMLPNYVDGLLAGTLKPNTHATIASETDAIAVLDGNQGYGQVIGAEAMAIGLDKARQKGLALVALRNSYHLGRIGAWAEQCADAGFVSMHYVNVISGTPGVAPFGGGQGRFGTNPYCAGVPRADGRHVILDMATSKIAIGKVRVARNKRQQIAAATLIDSEGLPTTDPNVIFSDPRGAIVPFGEHKGSGLALMCEILAGALTGGGGVHRGEPRKTLICNHMLSILVDPGAIGERNAFAAEVEGQIKWVASARPQPGVDQVMIAGDPERNWRARRLAEGIPVDAGTWKDLVEAAAKVGVAVSAP